MLNERQILYLKEIAKEQNITSAAKKLYISQPALSRFLLDLEKELGVKLFIRNHSSVYLTREGETYLSGCRKVENVYRDTLREIHDLQNPGSGKLSIAMTSLVGDAIFPAVLERCQKDYPEMEINLVEARILQMEGLLLSGQIDLAVAYEKGGDDLHSVFLRKDDILLAVPEQVRKEMPASGYGFNSMPLPAEQIEKMPVILLKKGRTTRKLVDRYFEQHKIHPDIFLETDSIHLAMDLVRKNKGYTFVPEIVAHSLYRENKDTFFSTGEDFLQRSMHIWYRKEAYVSNAMKFLIQAVTECCGSGEPFI